MMMLIMIGSFGRASGSSDGGMGGRIGMYGVGVLSTEYGYSVWVVEA
jgi:hypothetical protein